MKLIMMAAALMLGAPPSLRRRPRRDRDHDHPRRPPDATTSIPPPCRPAPKHVDMRRARRSSGNTSPETDAAASVISPGTAGGYNQRAELRPAAMPTVAPPTPDRRGPLPPCTAPSPTAAPRPTSAAAPAKGSSPFGGDGAPALSCGMVLRVWPLHRFAGPSPRNQIERRTKSMTISFEGRVAIVTGAGGASGALMRSSSPGAAPRLW